MTPLVMLLPACAFLSIMLAIVPNLLWLIVWLIGKCFHCSVSYAPFGWTSLALALLVWLVMMYGYLWGRWKLDLVPVSYQHQDIPASFSGYKIVHISDLHLSTFNDNPQKLDRIVDSINAQHPDLICFTGDLVTLGVKEAQPYEKKLRRLHARDGVMSVLGNHDFLLYAHYPDEPSRIDAVEQLVQFERQNLGWTVLRNQNKVIEAAADSNDRITIIGIDNQKGDAGFRTISCGDLEVAKEGVDGFCILLSHDPGFWSSVVLRKTTIPLTLSGHTHAAQLRFFGWNPANWMFKETDGRYDEAGQTLYVNIGLGCTIPIRLGANPEITVITLLPSETASSERALSSRHE